MRIAQAVVSAQHTGMPIRMMIWLHHEAGIVHSLRITTVLVLDTAADNIVWSSAASALRSLSLSSSSPTGPMGASINSSLTDRAGQVALATRAYQKPNKRLPLLHHMAPGSN